MKNKIDEINKAIDAGAYIAALALSLTLPDICGQIEYPDLRVGDRYVKWFDRYVKPLYFIKNENAPNNQFDGEMCYALRCALFHSWNFELKQKPSIKFILHIDKVMGSHNVHNLYVEEEKSIVDLDAYGICYYIAHAAQDYYYNHKNKKVFEKYDCVIIDESWPDSDYEKIFKWEDK